jgi:uncharacterized membrane protein
MKMTGYDFFLNFWWVMPLVMIVFCFFMKKRCDVKTMCGWETTELGRLSDSAGNILDKRLAQGEVDRKEYETIKRTLKEI